MIKNNNQITPTLMNHGIKGLMISKHSGIPLIIRDYTKNGNPAIPDPILFSGFISAINIYAESSDGWLQDLSIGHTRLFFKLSRLRNIYTLFLSERIIRSQTFENVMMCVEIILQKIMRNFEAYDEITRMHQKFSNDTILLGFQDQADRMLLEAYYQAINLLGDTCESCILKTECPSLLRL